MKKLRIAVITTEFVTETYISGGIANHFFRLFKEIASYGHDVHIFTQSDRDNESFLLDKLNIHRINVDDRFNRILNRLSLGLFRETIETLYFSFMAYAGIRRMDARHRFDLVQFCNYPNCGLFAAMFLPIPAVNMVASYTAVWNKLGRVKRNIDIRLIEWIEWLQFKFSRNIYAPSYTLKRLVEKQVHISNVNVIRTPIYIETRHWDFSVYNRHLKDKTYLLFFGRYQLHKGFHILAKALPPVLRKFPEAHAVFVGPDKPSRLGPSMKEYARLQCKKDSDRLIFIDQISHARLYPIISRARLVVLPSLIDNLPNTLIESMTLGKPVIGTIGASFDELIVDGKNGFLVPAGDLTALSQKIIEVWLRPDLNEIGQTAKKTVKALSPERTVRELLAYYEGVLALNKS
jgi:glycosyltransferase involved in cell wall biosynthesis